MIDAWYDHAANGKPYEGNTKERWFSQAEGGSSLSSYHAYDDKIPAEVKTEVKTLEGKINSKELVIPVDLAVPTSD